MNHFEMSKNFFDLEILSFKSDLLATKIIITNNEHLLKCLYVY